MPHTTAPLKTDLIQWALARDERMMVIPTNMEVRSDGAAVMGRGLALQAKTALPGLEREYAEMLARFTAFQAQMIGQPAGTPAPQLPEALMRGQLFLTPKAVLLPTKVSWRKKSDPAFVQAGLHALARLALSMPHMVFGVPLLGAGEGGLDTETAREMLLSTLGRLHNVALIEPPEPQAAPVPVPAPARPAQTTRPAAYKRSVLVPPATVKTTTVWQDAHALTRGKKILVVSGHRPDKLGGYGAANLEALVTYCMAQLRDVSPEIVVHGGALGTDMAFAEAARRLGVATLYAEPCLEQDARWFETSRRQAEVHREYARKTGLHVVVTAKPYAQAGPGCMHLRNDFMVTLLRNAGEGSGFMYMHNGTPGGTASCIKSFARIVPEEVQVEMDLGNIYPGWKALQTAKFVGLAA